MTLVLTLDCLHSLILSAQGTVLRQFPLAWCFFTHCMKSYWSPRLPDTGHQAIPVARLLGCAFTDKGAVIFACKECHWVIGSWESLLLKEKKTHAESVQQINLAEAHFALDVSSTHLTLVMDVSPTILFHNLLSGSSFWMWIQGYILFI